MTSYANHNAFLYTTRRLSPRDALLFKTLMRLLTRELKHGWAYDPELAQLLVLGEEDPQLSSLQELPLPNDAVVLHVGKNHGGYEHHITLPLLPNELEPILNRIGDQLLVQVRTQRSTTQSAQAMGGASASDAVRTPAIEAAKSFANNTHWQARLKQWPPQRLLTNPARVKMATILLGQSLNAQSLADKTAIPVQQVVDFLDVLHASGCLNVAHMSRRTDAALAQLFPAQAVSATRADIAVPPLEDQALQPAEEIVRFKTREHFSDESAARIAPSTSTSEAGAIQMQVPEPMLQTNAQAAMTNAQTLPAVARTSAPTPKRAPAREGFGLIGKIRARLGL